MAVVSDLHLSESAYEMKLASKVFADIFNEQADLVLVLGDLISSPTDLTSPSAHRGSVLDLLKILPRDRTAIVLGNYESWDDPEAWLTDLQAQGFYVLENEVRVFETDEGFVCVRGLGDRYTNRYATTPLPDRCDGLPTVTISHDPAAAFEDGVEGLIIAGHTHCGQVSIPFVGPLWAPTEAPREAWCGLYQDELRTLWVSSGVGTSILPIRLGAPSQWDLLNVTLGPIEAIGKEFE